MKISEYMVDRAAVAIRAEMMNNGWMISGITPQRLKDRVRAAARRALEAALKNEEDRMTSALQEIASEIKPELCSSELELIVWWGRQVARLQDIANSALTQG